jgi:hypothetical protein
MEKLLIADVIAKSFQILADSSDIHERQNAQETIDKVVELIGKSEVARIARSLIVEI